MGANEFVPMRYRFDDTTYQTSVFEDSILICCPDCHHPATIYGGTKLSCRNCGFNAAGPGLNAFAEAGTSMMGGKRLWFGRYMALLHPKDGACKYCGFSLRRDLKRENQDTPGDPRLSVTCSSCDRSQDVTVDWHPTIESTEARDPYFGAPLYLTRALTVGKIYAYNQEHAKLMLDFISSKQGDTVGDCPFFKSLFTVVPAWIKCGKHRSSVIRALRSMVNSANSFSGPLGHSPP